MFRDEVVPGRYYLSLSDLRYCSARILFLCLYLYSSLSVFLELRHSLFRARELESIVCQRRVHTSVALHWGSLPVYNTHVLFLLSTCLSRLLSRDWTSFSHPSTNGCKTRNHRVCVCRKAGRERERGRARACTRGPVPSSTEAAARRRRPAVCLRSLSLSFALVRVRYIALESDLRVREGSRRERPRH